MRNTAVMVTPLSDKEIKMNKGGVFFWKQKGFREELGLSCTIHQEQIYKFTGSRTAFIHHISKLNAKHKDNEFAVEVTN